MMLTMTEREGSDYVLVDDCSELMDDPTYGKFFKMLKMGVPEGAVKQRLEQFSLDPSVIDLDPPDLKNILRSGGIVSASKIKPKQKLKMESKEKFLKMLEMGVPLEAVKHALKLQGYDPSIIDIDLDDTNQTRRTVGTLSGLKTGPGQKYLKMLEMGLPLEAVKHALNRDGYGQHVLHMDPADLKNILRSDKTLSALRIKPEQKMKIESRQRFLKMLEMGVPIEAVKHVLQLRGFDPSIMD
mmetsp:Transcript_1956/g.2311  ORF Transcript_1956/g.2311 Transcript_1956/m.2311 type:complete len:241 (+) Transcript_1956:165-887(+)